MQNEPLLVIAGGGAAGFFTALTVAEQLKGNATVMLLEKSNKVLSKVRISGGGRCNVTHHCFDPAVLAEHYPRGHKELRAAFHRFQPADTIRWFEQRGVELKTEADGRMFPVSDSSETIVNCLLREADRLGVTIRKGLGIKEIDKELTGFRLSLDDGSSLYAHKLLLACGGFNKPTAYEFIRKLGISIIDPVPSLFTFVINDPALRDLAGISLEQAELSLPGLSVQSGAMLITHQGLSGPAVLKLSAWGAREMFQRQYRFQLEVNFLPAADTESLKEYLLELRSTWNKKQLLSQSPVDLPLRLWQYLCQKALPGLNLKWADLSNKHLLKLQNELQACNLQVQAKNTFKDEFVTAGGVDLKKVDFKSMESREVPGVYFAGEILDIDGVTGGFNFQAAWTTGWIAGRAMAAAYSNVT